MTKRIWKYDLEITESQFIHMPEDAKILSVENQYGDLCLWALVDPEKRHTIRDIHIIGTGNPIHGTPKLTFIGTVIIKPLVWHVFERMR